MELWKWWSYGSGGVMEVVGASELWKWWSCGSGGAMEVVEVEEDIYENPPLSHIKKAEASSFQGGSKW